jgi:cyanophycinase-like exopeptidase
MAGSLDRIEAFLGFEPIHKKIRRGGMIGGGTIAGSLMISDRIAE